jgi:K(+)-stimulated pyrophosphate-energized sodium pump
MLQNKRSIWTFLLSSLMFLLMAGAAFAGEADIKLPDLTTISFLGGALSGIMILNAGLVVCFIGMIFGIMQYVQTKNLPAHKAMLDVSQTIWETCKTYLFQQGKFLVALWILIAVCMVYYFGVLQGKAVSDIIIILVCSIVGILGSYTVAWFGIRINTVANSRAAFASLSGDPLNIVNICLRSGMSVGLLLVSIELFFMIIILAYIPKELAGPSFIGFAIGESLGASALRICGGIFTKIADIGSDLMKIVFHLPEDDPKNPGVIADCTGDNAGDSVGPTADGFETYGVTGVALIAFLALALAGNPAMGGKLIIWIFAMRILMILTSLVSYFVNDIISKAMFAGKKEFNFEHPLTNLVWITSIVSIAVTFAASYYLLGDLTDAYTGLWLPLLSVAEPSPVL